MIVFAHTKFGLVPVGYKGAKLRGGGGGGIRPPGLSEFLKSRSG